MTSTQHMRQRIVQMAHTLFVQQGVEETTMVAIAEAVGCSRRTVYTYYKDKQALLMAVIEREISLMSQSLSEVLSRPADAITKLMVLLDNHLQLIQKTVQRRASTMRASLAIASTSSVFASSMIRASTTCSSGSCRRDTIEESY